MRTARPAEPLKAQRSVGENDSAAFGDTWVSMRSANGRGALALASAIEPLKACQRSKRAPSTAFYCGAMRQVSCAQALVSVVSPLEAGKRAPASPPSQLLVFDTTVRSLNASRGSPASTMCSPGASDAPSAPRPCGRQMPLSQPHGLGRLRHRGRRQREQQRCPQGGIDHRKGPERGRRFGRSPTQADVGFRRARAARA